MNVKNLFFIAGEYFLGGTTIFQLFDLEELVEDGTISLRKCYMSKYGNLIGFR